jgi:hypothetical protein
MLTTRVEPRFVQAIPLFMHLVAIRWSHARALATLDTSKPHPQRRNTVNIAKHMEAVFVVALAAAGSANFLSDALQDAQARPAVIQDSSIATETKMAVVVVKGKRPAAAERRTVLADGRQAGSRI